MSKLSLPPPKVSKWAVQQEPRALKEKSDIGPPPYGKRSNFVPKSVLDYGDGGAFPEIHFLQFPLNMGKNISGPGYKGTLALETTKDGKNKYDLVIAKDSNMKSSLADMTPMDIPQDGFLRPSEEEVNETTQRTRAALEAIVDFKIQATQPKQSAVVSKPNGGATYVRYTPASGSDQGSGTKIIKMMEAPVDPFEPPKYKIKKVPRGPPSPPPPVMHSPPRKVSAEEQKNWVIPACVSNWKNAKGYTIPLDKRLAADGRGLHDVTINDNFAKLSEALFIADKHAREEVKLRGEMANKLAAKEKKDKEEKLRLLAQKAREERAGLGSAASLGLAGYSSDEESRELSKEEAQQLKEREEIRKDREKQRQRELRISHMGTDTKSRILTERYFKTF
jgi:SNW domain-containing protein 1